MKKITIIMAVTMLLNTFAMAQVIDNKGNSSQSYPKVVEPDPAIAAMVAQVDTNNLYNSVDWMQQYIRDASSVTALLTQNWLVDQFESFGLEVTVDYFPNPIGGSQYLEAGSVVAVQQGTEFPDEIIIISSHYDHPDGPGADDNASGTSGVLECARILSQYEFKRTIYYIPFNAEEYWMVGSYPYAENCAREDLNIIGVLNMDMIGWWPEEMGEITMYSGYSEISKNLFEFYQTVANLYKPEMPTRLFSAGDSYGGDHMSFNIFEYPALYIGDIEYHSLHPCYHEPCDSIGAGLNCFRLAEGFVQSVLATTAELANGWFPPQHFSAVSTATSVNLSWDAVENASKYLLYRDDNLLAELTETEYVDNSVELDSVYEYYVQVVDAEGNQSGTSNKDKIRFCSPLALPYFNDMEQGIDELYFPYSEWFRIDDEHHDGSYSLTNHSTGNLPSSYLTTIEFPWFALDDTIKDVNLNYFFKGTLSAIWINTGLFVEVTTDRKTWHKLEKILEGMYGSWTEHSVSLNEYIGSPFVQVRFRLESSGSKSNYIKRAFIDDVRLIYSSDWGVEEEIETSPFVLSVHPNPACSKIQVYTGMDGCYQLRIFDLQGKCLLNKASFSDGPLDVSSLPSGSYLLRVEGEYHALAKKIMIE